MPALGPCRRRRIYSTITFDEAVSCLREAHMKTSRPIVCLASNRVVRMQRDRRALTSAMHLKMPIVVNQGLPPCLAIAAHHAMAPIDHVPIN